MPQQASPTPPTGPDAALQEAHRRLLQHRALQFDFQPFAPPKPRAPVHTPAWLNWIIHALDAITPALKVVFWAGIAALVLLIVYLIAREAGYIRFGSRQNRQGVKDFTYQPDAAVARALLADADALAAEGRFAEAIHVLLQRSIEDMRTRRPQAIAPSLTSRDIAVLPILPQAVRPAFAAMARLVEHSLFAGRPVGAEDFNAARASYEAFALPGAW